MTDKAFRTWIQTLPSCLTGRFSEWLPELGEWRNIAAHVRRAGESGTAYKAPHSCVPLTNEEHLYQHQHGELACLVRFSRDPQLKCSLLNAAPIEAERIAGEWFDTKRDEYRRCWKEKTGQSPWEERETENA